MNLAAVMDQLAARINTISGLRTFAFPPNSLAPPAAVVSYPEEYTYDETYGRGMDRMTVPVVVLVGKVSDRASRDQLGQYVDGSGAKSIKAVVESGTYTAFDSARVMTAEFDVVTVGGVDHMAATLNIDIAGEGEP